MIAIHILALMIGALPVYFTATGKLRGGYVDRATGEHREGGAAAARADAGDRPFKVERLTVKR